MRNVKEIFDAGKIIILICMVLLSNINAQEIVSKNQKYDFQNRQSKVVSDYYFSESIRIPIENPEPFVAIGLIMKREKSNLAIDILIRGSVDGINWNNWENMYEGENTEESDQYFTGLLFLDKNVKYLQFKTTSYKYLTDLNFSFISPGNTPKNQIKENLKTTSLNKTLEGYERPAYVYRKEWGCPQDENVNSRTLTDVTHLIIHHSAGHTVSSDYAAVVRSYWDYHVNSREWSDIGYNWLVDPNGVLYKGRAWKSETQENIQGAHAAGANGNSAGICLIGNYEDSEPSSIGLDKIEDILAFLSDKYDIDPLGRSYHEADGIVNDNITGHRFAGTTSTLCPGQNVVDQFEEIRNVTYLKRWGSEIPPELVSTFPASTQDSAYLSKQVSIKFSQPMNQTTVENAFAIIPTVEGDFSWNSSGNELYFLPSDKFESKTDYNITIDTSAKNIWNVSLEDSIKFNFITKTYDKLSLISVFPENGATDVDINVSIEIQFDDPIDSGSLPGNLTFVDDDSNYVGVNLYSILLAEGIIRLTPQTTLKEDSEYYVILKNGISSNDGYSLGLDKTIIFTTKTVTSVNGKNIISEYELFDAYPNPFNPSTTIKYSIPNVASSIGSRVVLTIYDVLGKVAKTLVNENQKPGYFEVTFDASNLTSGIYYYQLKAGNFIETKKMILLK